MCHLNILFVEMFSCLLPVSNQLIIIIEFWSSLYVLDTHLLLNFSLQIFSPIFKFISLSWFFSEQTFSILMRSSLPNFFLWTVLLVSKSNLIVEKYDQHYLNQFIKVRISSSETCWQYVPLIMTWWKLYFMSVISVLKTVHISFIMWKISDKSQLRDILQNICQGHPKQGKSEKLSQRRGSLWDTVTKDEIVSWKRSWSRRSTLGKN